MDAEERKEYYRERMMMLKETAISKAIEFHRNSDTTWDIRGLIESAKLIEEYLKVSDD